ncbi:NYN domain-containing protein [Fertoebacter nigrum]|uniref:NYN domain-containing protein n=1 Tax=Fertoeibacter niger TaxID=2656921 RepID=A0A8X8GV44_9RHOB|nr:NYN domain-containing protein [Fertoeibacter niger]
MDGFNLYHALDDLRQPYLKWLSLRRLAEKFSRGHAHEISELVFCTAFFPGDFDKRKRHEAYNAAQAAQGARIVLGHTTKEPMTCRACTSRWDQPREKETDINVALSAYADVARSSVDVIFLVTADTDQAATLRFVRDNFPRIKRVVVTPPGREKSKHLRDLSDANIGLSLGDIDEAILPAMFENPAGKLIVRPAPYAPPSGWVHPHDRPK